MRILMTNVVLRARTGTEVVTLELAAALAGRGHEVAVFSPDVGESGRTLMASGIRVLTGVPDPGFRPDIIHGHHNVPLVQAVVAYPNAPAIFVCHDATQWTDSPPFLSRIRNYVAVDRRCLGRLHEELPEISDRTLVVHNAVDLAKFEERDRLPSRPRSALVLAKHAAPLQEIREACDKRGVRLSELGPDVGNVSEELHRILPRYDLVFATARSAIEALAAGCAVILVDGRGCGRLVTSGNVRDYREFNFGAGVLKAPATGAGLAEQIDRYAPEDAFEVSCFIREHNSLERAASIYETLYSDALKHYESTPAEREAEEVSRALSPWLPGLDRLPAIASSPDKIRAEYQRLLSEHEALVCEHKALLNSRSRLFRALTRAVRRKLR